MLWQFAENNGHFVYLTRVLDMMPERKHVVTRHADNAWSKQLLNLDSALQANLNDMPHAIISQHWPNGARYGQ